HGENKIIAPPAVVDETNDMINVLNDIRRQDNYIDHNNGPDIASTSNEPPEDVGPTKDDLEGLFEMANEELFSGCTWMSSLDFLAKMSHIKVFHKMTDTCFDDTMEFLIKCFPKGAKVPKSHYEAKKSMKKVGLGYESIHACVNDCCLFWEKNKDLHYCPTCNASRWKDKEKTGREVPNKVLCYFPLLPRLKRMYGSLHTAKHMTWHATGQCTKDGKMGHPVDGSTWKEFDKNNADFAKEPRNVRLGLAADGFNPFGNLSQSYSMWPVILTTYNTPPWICMKESSFMLTLLIPGPKSPGKDIDVYLQPLVKELKTLWKKPGVKTLDVATNTEFRMRVMLLWTISDFPARSSLSGWSGQGYMACPTCNDETPSTRVNGKTAYVGHRRFLPSTHSWRRKKTFNGKNETDPPPPKLTSAQILRQLAKVPSRTPGKHPSHGV
ncbi:CACTA transposable element, partial [Tanacetum coccineum]